MVPRSLFFRSRGNAQSLSQTKTNPFSKNHDAALEDHTSPLGCRLQDEAQLVLQALIVDRDFRHKGR
jgi:hypothetical protein